ncbi:hypothetical protein V4762_07395 [Thermodesulfobium sp. 4217-1]|uniref:hypothetical protein n=1 Tax=Thermodesulfobium sp. 4217-1 TaxID=3120013 RepID=UPI0032218595
MNSFTSLELQGMPISIRNKNFYLLNREKFNFIDYRGFLNYLQNQFDNSDFYKIKSISHTNTGKVDVVFYIPGYAVKSNTDNSFYDLNGNVLSNQNLKNKKIIYVNNFIKNDTFFDVLQNILFYSSKYGFVPSFIYFNDDVIKFKDMSGSVFEFKNDGNFDGEFKEIFEFLNRLNNTKWPKEIILLDDRRLVIKK